jgi:uncharacterized protein (DUF433 family)
MTTTVEPTTLPLRADVDGTIRIGGTRVTLDVVVEAFRNGESPEDIAEGLQAITLPDVYAAITYYLFHREQVEVYLRERDEKFVIPSRAAANLDLRQRLMARRSSIQRNGEQGPP